jgi:hypothetical protein
MFILKNSFGSFVDSDIADKPYKVHRLLYQLNAQICVILMLNVHHKHVSVQVYQLQGEQNASFKNLLPLELAKSY